MHTFGAGVLIGTASTDAQGNAIALPSPVQFGILQEVSVDEEYELKELYGANQYPVDLGRGKGKVTMKAKAANINAELFNTFIFGQTVNTGYEAIFQDLTGTTLTGGSTGAGVTPAPPNSGIYLADLGVQDANQIPFTRVAAGSAPTGGQYHVTGATATAAYVFSDVDVTAAVKAFINYTYTNATSPAAARRITVQNLPMGYAPVFQIDLMAQMHGKTYYIRYPNCISTKLSRTFKNDDFTIPEFDISAFADSSGNISYQYFSE
jgi:hypothetical protein